MRNKLLNHKIGIVAFALISSVSFAQKATVNVQLNTQHVVAGIEDFDREKYITIHASIESDWAGDHVMSNSRDFLEEYNVYLGRETGGLKGALNRVREDSKKPGFVDVNHLKRLAENTLKSYTRNNLASYEHRLNNMVIGSQFHPIWSDGNKTRKGWSLSQTDTESEPFGTASGQFMGHYIKEFYPTGVRKKPRFIEVINEPLWDIIPRKDRRIPEKELLGVQKMAKFHSTVAKEIKKLNPDVLVGGFTCAFPDFELYDFKRWEYRWKQFIDLTGEDMDFWSLHFYDFPCKQKYSKGKLSYIKKYRKGSNLKASLDMLEQYSMLQFGKLKPMLISEYSVQAHRYRDLEWTPWRDYLYVKSANAMMMTFMEHPQSIVSAIPFFMLKSEWGRTKEGHPYRSRLFRQQFEKKGETGTQWVYSDLVHFYQLWSDVKGKRIAITSDLIDVQTQAFVDGKKAYVVLNNLTEEQVSINLNLLNVEGNTLKKVKVKQHYAPYKSVEVEREGRVEETSYKSNLSSIVLEPEATMVLEYSFKKRIKLNETQEELKYYSQEYYQPIETAKEVVFHVNNVELEGETKAVLRIGIGRDHGKSLQPSVTVNGVAVKVPTNYAGEAQTDRERFYGVIEIPVKASVLQKNNNIAIQFADAGGHIATTTLRVFNQK
ncbi:hypothetical protein [Wenyingzhuangia sp. IMCC45574]